MTKVDQPTPRDSRFATWIGATVGLFFLSLVAGFVWLPAAQRGTEGLDLWSAICRAVGLPNGNAQAPPPIAGQPASTVAWTTETRQHLARADSIAGATIAQTCSGCHGTTGISSDAIIPNLAGQSAAAIYKQLKDFRTGKRNADVMGVYVLPLSEHDLLNIAAHYASQPNPLGDALSSRDPSNTAALHLIEVGDPIRGIAPCASCHGPLGITPGAPELRSQQRAYLELQMQSFKNGNRRNDISRQMRSVANQLTGEEIAMLAAYYSSISNVANK